MSKEIDFVHKDKFPRIEIYAKDLDFELKNQLNAKLLSLPQEEKYSYSQSIRFIEMDRQPNHIIEWIRKWENRKFPTKKETKKSPLQIFGIKGQVQNFMGKQPLFYDRTGGWWVWNFEDYCWERHNDFEDILNNLSKEGIDTITSKNKTEIVNAMKQIGRDNIPENLSKQCIQFKDKIIDISNGEEFESNYQYFSTNPIPHSIGKSEETPTMDKYFKEWVGEKYVNTLYEILAYSICSDQFMQRMIALVGGGSNGKGTFTKLLKNFVGKSNCSTSELAILSASQFETSTIYKKLVCEMGEVQHDDLKNTNQIKALSGENDIRYCFKGKTPFTDESTVTCIISTNSLPKTNDKTTGFYRRWLIIDFPNQFPIKSGIIESIPEEEYSNLARKSIRILKEMYQNLKFTNEGDFQERARRYEERSNPVMRFIEEYCEEDFEAYVSLKKFTKEINEYLQIKHLRAMNPKEIKSVLKEEGFDIIRTTKDYKKDNYIQNLKIIQNIQNIQ